MNELDEMFSSKRKRGRPRTPEVDPVLKQFALLNGYRAAKTSLGWVVVPPHEHKYTQTTLYPNAYLAWREAFGQAVSAPQVKLLKPDEIISSKLSTKGGR